MSGLWGGIIVTRGERSEGEPTRLPRGGRKARESVIIIIINTDSLFVSDNIVISGI